MFNFYFFLIVSSKIQNILKISRVITQIFMAIIHKKGDDMIIATFAYLISENIISFQTMR